VDFTKGRAFISASGNGGGINGLRL